MPEFVYVVESVDDSQTTFVGVATSYDTAIKEIIQPSLDQFIKDYDEDDNRVTYINNNVRVIIKVDDFPVWHITRTKLLH